MPRKMLRPPIEMRRKFAPLIELCRTKIITAPPQTSGNGVGDKTITVAVQWPLNNLGRPAMPKDFPTGMVVKRLEGAVLVKHSVVALLSYFKALGYCSQDAKDLFSARLPAMMVLAKMELKLDRLLQGVDVDLPQDSKDKLDSIDE